LIPVLFRGDVASSRRLFSSAGGSYSTATQIHFFSANGVVNGMAHRAPSAPVASTTRYDPWKYASTPCAPKEFLSDASVLRKLNRRGMCSCASPPTAAAAAAAAAAGDARCASLPRDDAAHIDAIAAVAAAASSAAGDARKLSTYNHVHTANPRLNGHSERVGPEENAFAPNAARGSKDAFG
jgi:hypothetical protein